MLANWQQTQRGWANPPEQQRRAADAGAGAVPGSSGAPVAEGSAGPSSCSLAWVGAPSFRQHEQASGHDETALQGHLAMKEGQFRAVLQTNA